MGREPHLLEGTDALLTAGMLSPTLILTPSPPTVLDLKQLHKDHFSEISLPENDPDEDLSYPVQKTLPFPLENLSQSILTNIQMFSLSRRL